MEYLSFTISDYRAIKGPLEVPLHKSKLLPIIGVNECGKTTVLQAILAFDEYNDGDLNGRHLADIENLYSPKPPPPCVRAKIKLDWSEIEKSLKRVCSDVNSKVGLKYYLDRKSAFTGYLEIERNLNTRYYRFVDSIFEDGKLNENLIEEIVRQLPFTIYFDDFRDSIEQEIEIPAKGNGGGYWCDVVEMLFAKSGCGVTLTELPSCEERRRKAALSKVNAHLKKVLTREWQSFRLDDVDALKVAVEYVSSVTKVVSKDPSGNTINSEVIKNKIKFEVVETSESGEEHFFFIRDRSKGFYWFFNFVMKLQFNPRNAGNSVSQRAVFLLDEPGCYLHAMAQKKLCKKLVEIAEDHVVAYCTHSHYLLDPQIVPIQVIRIADRGKDGEINLRSISTYSSDMHVNRTAFQPVIDALQLTPYSMELSGKNVVVVEGVTDYYALTAYYGEEFLFLPSVGADSIKFSVPFLLASATPFCALWDRDEQGIAARNSALKDLGEEFDKKFILLPAQAGLKKVVLENLFSKNDLTRLAGELGLQPNGDPKKLFPALFYSKRKSFLVSECDENSRSNFDTLRTDIVRSLTA